MPLNDDFDPYEVFDEEFGRRLKQVDKNVLVEWPKLRDDSHYNVLQNLRAALLDLPDIHELIELLGIYRICLEYMHRYPRKNDKAHYTSIKSLLKKDSRQIMSYLWFQQFKTIYPFGGYPLDDDLLLETSKYLFALFNLNDSSFGEEKLADLWLRDLCCAQPNVIIIAIHCFFFSRVNDTRRHAYKTLQIVLSMDMADFAFEFYFNEALGPDLSLRQFQLLLDRQDLADDCLVHLFRYITTIVPSSMSLPPLWQRSLLKSLSVLRRQCSGSDMEYEETLLSIKVPNYILKEYFACNQAPSHLSILTYVITQQDGMKAMASGITLFAKTFDYFEMEERPPNPRNLYEKHRNSCSEYYVDQVFLIPIILKELSDNKRWSTTEHVFASLLADKGKYLWRNTLNDLRALGDDEDALPEFHMLPAALSAWTRLGTLIGIHRVLEPIVGCCYASCPEFAKEIDGPSGQCSGCKLVEYCSTDCQKKDWAVHKRYCSSKKGSEGRGRDVGH